MLPNRPLRESDEVSGQPFGEPEGATPISVTQLKPGERQWRVTRDLIDYESALDVVNDLGVVRIDDIELDVTRKATERYSSMADDFGSIRGETAWLMGFRRGDWNVQTQTRTVLTSTATDFHLYAQLDAYENEKRIASLNWEHTIPRDHV